MYRLLQPLNRFWVVAIHCLYHRINLSNVGRVLNTHTTPHALSYCLFLQPIHYPPLPLNTHLPLYIHTSFFPPLLIITYTTGTLHFISSILSLQGWQAGHKLSWRWGWNLEEIVMKISSVCRSGRSCSCHQPCAGGITPGQRLCVRVWVCSSLFAYAWVHEHVNSYSVHAYTAVAHVSLRAISTFAPPPSCVRACSCVCR